MSQSFFMYKGYITIDSLNIYIRSTFSSVSHDSTHQWVLAPPARTGTNHTEASSFHNTEGPFVLADRCLNLQDFLQNLDRVANSSPQELPTCQVPQVAADNITVGGRLRLFSFLLPLITTDRWVLQMLGRDYSIVLSVPLERFVVSSTSTSPKTRGDDGILHLKYSCRSAKPRD
ncbi:hypothetical protein FKM82_006266 [Ascaphus truei]